jgi:hypothetical protein
MGNKPAIWWYAADWLADPAVSRCSPATRGIWMDALCAMWRDGGSGILTGTAEELSRICRCTADDIMSAAHELQTTSAAHVTISHKRVTLENRRMSREYKGRTDARLRQKRHRGDDDGHSDVTEMSLSGLHPSVFKPPIPPTENHILTRCGVAKRRVKAAAAACAGNEAAVVAVWWSLKQSPKVRRVGSVLAYRIEQGDLDGEVLTPEALAEAVLAKIVTSIDLPSGVAVDMGQKITWNTSGLLVAGKVIASPDDIAKVKVT